MILTYSYNRYILWDDWGWWIQWLNLETAVLNKTNKLKNDKLLTTLDISYNFYFFCYFCVPINVLTQIEQHIFQSFGEFQSWFILVFFSRWTVIKGCCFACTKFQRPISFTYCLYYHIGLISYPFSSNSFLWLSFSFATWKRWLVVSAKTIVKTVLQAIIQNDVYYTWCSWFHQGYRKICQSQEPIRCCCTIALVVLSGEDLDFSHINAI